MARPPAASVARSNEVWTDYTAPVQPGQGAARTEPERLDSLADPLGAVAQPRDFGVVHGEVERDLDAGAVDDARHRQAHVVDAFVVRQQRADRQDAVLVLED